MPSGNFMFRSSVLLTKNSPLSHHPVYSHCLPLCASLSASACFLVCLCVLPLSASVCFLVGLYMLPCLPLCASLSASTSFLACLCVLPLSAIRYCEASGLCFHATSIVIVCKQFGSVGGRICKAPNRALSAVSRNGCALAFCVLRVGAAQVAAVDPFPCISH